MGFKPWNTLGDSRGGPGGFNTEALDDVTRTDSADGSQRALDVELLNNGLPKPWDAIDIPQVTPRGDPIIIDYFYKGVKVMSYRFRYDARGNFIGRDKLL